MDIGRGNIQILYSDEKDPQTRSGAFTEVKPEVYDNFQNARDSGRPGIPPATRQAWGEQTVMETDEFVGEMAQSLPCTRKLLEAIEHLKQLFEKSEGEILDVLQGGLASKNSASACQNVRSQQILEMKKEIERLKGKETQMFYEAEILKTENRKLQEDLQKEKQKTVDVEGVKQRYQKEKERFRQQESEIKKYETDALALQRDKETLQSKLSQTTESFKTLMEEKKKVDDELKRCKSRLSQVMGTKLSDNNPEIADLSDQNRPTKLAEKYQSVYDDQWTDAFEEAEQFIEDEQKRAEAIKTLLIDIKGLCDRLYQRQTQTLLKAIGIDPSTTEKLDVDIAKQMKELRKTTAGLLVEQAFGKYLEEHESGTNKGRLAHNEKIKPFVHSCVEICLLMLVQDPPLAFLPDPSPGKPYDKEKYKFYTKTGSAIHYVVWPALLLHENGAVLTKGIAQAFPDKDEDGNVVPTGSTRRKNITCQTTKDLPLSQDMDRTPEDTVNRCDTLQSNDGGDTTHNVIQKQNAEVRNTVSMEGMFDTEKDKNTAERIHRHGYVMNNPTYEERSLFKSIGDMYGYDSKEIKERFGDRYKIIYDYFERHKRLPTFP